MSTSELLPSTEISVCIKANRYSPGTTALIRFRVHFPGGCDKGVLPHRWYRVLDKLWTMDWTFAVLSLQPVEPVILFQRRLLVIDNVRNWAALNISKHRTRHTLPNIQTF